MTKVIEGKHIDYYYKKLGFEDYRSVRKSELEARFKELKKAYNIIRDFHESNLHKEVNQTINLIEQFMGENKKKLDELIEMKINDWRWFLLDHEIDTVKELEKRRDMIMEVVEEAQKALDNKITQEEWENQELFVTYKQD